MKSSTINREVRGVIVSRYGTLGNFADVTGLHLTQLSHVLSGRRRLDQAQAVSWRLLLGCDDELIRPLVKRDSA